MKPAWKALFSFLFLTAVLMALGIALCIGFGALLARWLPLSLFQASGLAIGATLAVAALIHVLSAIFRSHPAYDLDDNFEEEGEDDFDTTDGTPVFANPDFSRARPNDYCPCGSGKKLKNCCETSTVT